MNKKLFILVALMLTFSLTACLDGGVKSNAELQTRIREYINSEDGRNEIGRAVEKYFQKKQEDARAAEEQREQEELEEQFKNPVKIDVGDSPATGPSDAKVTIVEFSDFQCPYCSRGKATMDEILKAYPNDVRLVFKHLPLGFHEMAKPCALATMAAANQGKFWEMHDAFFENQGSLSEEFIVATAEKLGLDMNKFNADRASEGLSKKLEDDIKLARENGISGTPGFFVNGVAVKGAYPFEHFKKIIDRWLEK